ncbi:6052_t:CDS:1, partial [Scutellospora calospora]
AGIIYAHESVTRRYAEEHGGVVVGIVVASSMETFSPVSIRVAETAKDPVVLLSDKYKFRLYILNTVLDSRRE